MGDQRHSQQGSGSMKRRRFLQYGAMTLGTGFVTACTASRTPTDQAASPTASASPTTSSGELTKSFMAPTGMPRPNMGAFIRPLPPAFIGNMAWM